MRIWDIEPKELCRVHLLGEHRELHALWTIISQNKKGYINHPETKRWIGKLAALYKRHEAEVDEMLARGYSHKSDLDARFATGDKEQTEFLATIEEQKELLRLKGCSCVEFFST